MATIFYRGQRLGREDLNIYLINSANTPVDAAEISYALFDFTTGYEVLVGAPAMTPANPSVGEYFASVVIPLDANLGSYRIRWTFREIIGGAVQQVVQEFSVIDKVGLSTASASMITGGVPNASMAQLDLMGRLRILLRDNNPDRNYSFRPPAHEETVSQFSRVFGHIWEDVELQEYLERSLDMVSAAPPRTPFMGIDQMVLYRPEWRTLLLTGAMMFAIQALRLNWIADEFSLVGETKVRLILDSEEVDVTLEELYGLLESDTALKVKQAFSHGRLKVRAVLDGEVCEASVTRVLRHHTPHKNIHVIATRLGSVRVTGDHSLFLFNGGHPEAVCADTLKRGDVIAAVVDAVVVGAEVDGVEVAAAVEWTYDLSVPGPENFALTNGLLAHNSYSIGGVSLDLEKSSKYEGAFSSLSEQFDKMLEKAKGTINVIKGLQQPRYGTGLRSAFGPYTGRGILSPQKFVGF